MIRGKNGKEKTAVAWLVGSHVAAVCAVVIQLKFQSDNLEYEDVNEQMENRLCLVSPRHLLLQTPSCQPLPSRKQLRF